MAINKIKWSYHLRLCPHEVLDETRWRSLRCEIILLYPNQWKPALRWYANYDL